MLRQQVGTIVWYIHLASIYLLIILTVFVRNPVIARGLLTLIIIIVLSRLLLRRCLITHYEQILLFDTHEEAKKNHIDVVDHILRFLGRPIDKRNRMLIPNILFIAVVLTLYEKT